MNVLAEQLIQKERAVLDRWKSDNSDRRFHYDCSGANGTILGFHCYGREPHSELIRSLANLSQVRFISFEAPVGRCGFPRDINDSDVRALGNLGSLEVLILNDTRITDACLDDLAKLKKLRKLFISRTFISPNGAEALRQSLPGCEIRCEESW